MSDFLVILSIDIFDHGGATYEQNSPYILLLIPLGMHIITWSMLFGTIKISEIYEFTP